MTVKSIRLDPGDLFLGLMALCLIGLFGSVSVPNLVSIIDGSHRAMRLPDDAEIVLAPWISGQVDLAKLDGTQINMTGWASDPRQTDPKLKLRVYYGAQLMAEVLARPPDAASTRRDQWPYTIRFPAPAGFRREIPFRVFAQSPQASGKQPWAVELFRGAAPVFLADEQVPRPSASGVR